MIYVHTALGFFKVCQVRNTQMCKTSYIIYTWRTKNMFIYFDYLKNSCSIPCGRSYYRCTTQKCTVKKRVERSFQDPATVITTYEGTHNHHLPATLRGNVAGMFAHPMLNSGNLGAGLGFPHHLVQRSPMNHLILNYGSHDGRGLNSSMYQQQQQQQEDHMNQYPQLQLSEFGLLQDIVPSMGGFKQEP